MPPPWLCWVTDRRRIGGGADLGILIDHIARLARAGIDLIHVRERDLDGGVLLRLVEGAVAATRGTGARVVVNDRADVALAGGADGVHLRGDSVPAARVRAMAPHGWLVGRSVHAVEEAALVSAAGGVDYLVAGTTFRSASKPAEVPLRGAAGLGDICRASAIPVLAIGGLSEATASRAAAAGAAGLAAIDLFAGERDERRLTELIARLRGSWIAAAPSQH
jgi:thiamine-phosphate pyrophosphorylase